MTFPYGRVSKPLHFIGKRPCQKGGNDLKVSNSVRLSENKVEWKSVLQRSLSGLKSMWPKQYKVVTGAVQIMRSVLFYFYCFKLSSHKQLLLWYWTDREHRTIESSIICGYIGLLLASAFSILLWRMTLPSICDAYPSFPFLSCLVLFRELWSSSVYVRRGIDGMRWRMMVQSQD